MATVVDFEEQPISRTYQYRKVMKPMLERKRRARINRCLDELKELMVGALQAEGENVSKLEKADVLELTVRHLHKLKHQQVLGMTPEVSYADRFKAGFTHCASEVSKYLAAVPGVDMTVSARLLAHLGVCLRHMEKTSPSTLQVSVANSYTPPSSPLAEPVSPASPVNLSGRYCVVPLPRAESTLSVCSESSQSSSASNPMWRPW